MLTKANVNLCLQEALRKAKAAQDKAGQQSNRMTEIAKQARSEVER